LAQEYGFDSSQTYSPENEVSESDLLKVHTKAYLDSLSTSGVVASIAEVPPLALFPNFLIQRQMLTPMRFATEGTTLAAKLAVEQYGWAINLGGGYHHAKTRRGEGFCVYADIPLAVHRLMKDPTKNFGVKRVLIVDLDAHQGNGFQTLYTSPTTAGPMDSAGHVALEYTTTDDIQIFDMYNGEIYPGDTFAQQFITYDYPLKRYTKDKEYLETLSTDLPAAINNCRPDIVFYNAGTDIYEKDPLGSLSITREAIIARDEIVFRLCRNRNIPIVMVLSGGYTLASADIIASSIKNLHEKDIISLTALPRVESK
jgi:histone deacetylase 11